MATARQGQRSGVRLLIVEDSEPVLTSVRAVIAALRPSWTIRTSTTASAGLDLLGHEDVDVALVDMELPDMSGLDLCQRIKGSFQPGASQVAVLVFSGIAWQAEQRGRRSGIPVDAYLDKPLSPVVIVERIESVLRQHGRL